MTSESPATPVVAQSANSIELCGWNVKFQKRPLLASDEYERWVEEIGLTSLPEMVFGHNYVSLQHVESGFEYHFNAREALDLVDKNASSIEVGYADHWKNSKIANGEGDKLIQSKAFDWTFSTPYMGTAAPGFEPTPTNLKLDVERLKRPDPILLFGELLLFEDELGDNGCSMLSVKTRVMPTCLFALMRLYVRVDEVLFRMLDCRIYHEFGQKYVIREIQHREASYQEMQKRLPVDKSKINDQNLMSTLIPLRREECVAFSLQRADSTAAAAAAATSITTASVTSTTESTPSETTTTTTTKVTMVLR